MDINKSVQAVEHLFRRERKKSQPQNVNVRHAQSLGLQDRIALAVTTAIGTMYAVYFFSLFMAGWMLWQCTLHERAFDPYPYAFLLFIGNIVQLLLMPLIMVGQNIQARHAEMRAEEQYKTTVQSYDDIEHIMQHLDAQDKEILKHTQMLAQLLQEREVSTNDNAAQ
jgi:uncharacterized membrane protein